MICVYTYTHICILYMHMYIYIYICICIHIHGVKEGMRQLWRVAAPPESNIPSFISGTLPHPSKNSF